MKTYLIPFLVFLGACSVPQGETPCEPHEVYFKGGCLESHGEGRTGAFLFQATKVADDTEMPTTGPSDGLTEDDENGTVEEEEDQGQEPDHSDDDREQDREDQDHGDEEEDSPQDEAQEEC